MVYKWLNNSLNKLFPYFCALCGDAAQTHIAICKECHNKLKYIDNKCTQCAIPLTGTVKNGICGQCIMHAPHFDQSTSLFTYNTPARQLISRLKFQKKLSLARLFGTLLAQLIEQQNRENLPDCIAPVPLSRKRLKDRSFNQAIEIARPVSNTLGIPLAYTLFERIRHSPAQSSLNLNARQKNVRGAFRIKYKKLPEHIAILDDVVTTGSTCNELARILKKQGVKKVEIWSIARAIRD